MFAPTAPSPRAGSGRVAGVPVDEFVRARPGAPLRDAIAWYSGYRQVDVPPARHRGLPSPFLTFIVTLDDPLVLAGADGTRAGFDVMIAGLHTQAATVVHDGRQSGVQVAVDPLACRSLFGLPAGELAGLDCRAEDVLPTALVEQLRTAVLDGDAWPERLAGLDTQLHRLAGGARRDGVPPEVRHAWRRLLDTGGRMAVEALAGETGWSARHLRTHFRAETGLTPKQAARVVRFDRVRRALARAPHGVLADLAAQYGYADQSHLDREFRALAGCTPTRWLAEEFRNIQGGHWAPPPD